MKRIIAPFAGAFVMIVILNCTVDYVINSVFSASADRVSTQFEEKLNIDNYDSAETWTGNAVLQEVMQSKEPVVECKCNQLFYGDKYIRWSPGVYSHCACD